MDLLTRCSALYLDFRGLGFVPHLKCIADLAIFSVAGIQLVALRNFIQPSSARRSLNVH